MASKAQLASRLTLGSNSTHHGCGSRDRERKRVHVLQMDKVPRVNGRCTPKPAVIDMGHMAGLTAGTWTAGA